MGEFCVMKKILTVCAALAVCAGLVLTMEKQPDYALAAVEVRDISEKIESVGTVGYAHVYALTPNVTGTVARVFVEPGQSVHAGQAVAEMQLLPENAGQLMASMQNVELSQAQLQEETLKACTVTAPAEGTVLTFDAYEGMQAAPGAALGSVVSREKTVTALIPESAREDVRVGQKASVFRDGRTYGAEIASIEPAQGASAQYTVTLTSSAFASLEAGMKVDVSIVLSECSAPAVPLQAIQPDGTLLCKTETGTAAVSVVTGLCDETYAQLVEGPPVGTQVVTGEG